MHTPGIYAAGIVAILLWSAPFSAGNAQTAITYTDIKTAYAVGQMRTEFTTPPNMIVTVAIGKPSMSPQAWDFTALPFEQSASVEFVDPGDAPYSSRFTTANVVRRTTTRAISEAFYQYNQLGSDGYSLLGYYVEGDASPFVCSPPLRQVKLPCALGSSWTYTADPAHPAPDVTVVTRHYFVVDAQGSMKIPKGTYPALRLRCETETETQTPTGGSLVRQYRFSYVTPGMISVTVAVDSDQAGLTAARVTGVGMEIPSGPVEVGREPSANSTLFRLRSVYPNPLRNGEQACFAVDLPRESFVRLRVYDLLGREAATAAVGILRQGARSVLWAPEGLTPGIYLCRFSMGSATSAIRLLIMR